MDPLSDIVSLLRPHSAVSKPISGRGRWGVRYAAYGAPGFALVLAGRCWLELEGEAPLALECGDFVLLPATPAFALMSAPGVACTPAVPGDAPVRHGEQEGAAEVELLGGTFSIAAVNAPLLLGLLPRMALVRAEPGERVGRLVALLMEECVGARPGGEMIVQRLLEVLLVETLRLPGKEAAAPAGLLAGLRDAPLAGALGAMHADPAHDWRLEALAKRAGMSRSGFAARFKARVGCAPMEYLARWRMQLAQDALSRGPVPLEQLAERVGYESASALSTAFRKRVGCAPGAFARGFA
ncbi:MAG TPA: AraC family transcriptional regulator [Terricaulis sp.]|nr:AraC family transcriptional regulator [Terricaulis sp.]